MGWTLVNTPGNGYNFDIQGGVASAPLNRQSTRAMLKTTHKFVISDEYIAEAQRLSIAQNKTLKFLYQTWWAWWLPRLAFVVLMIVFYLNNLESTAVLLGVCLFFLFAGEWFGQRNLAKA